MDGLAERDPVNQQDLAWEGRTLADAEPEADAGLLITSAEVNAWIGSLGTPNPLPLPRPRRIRAKPACLAPSDTPWATDVRRR
jgi:hypothetical protein